MELTELLGWETVSRVKLAVATLGVALLLAELLLRSAGRPLALRRLRDGLLAAAGAAALLCWWNLFQFHFEGSHPGRRWVNHPDAFHYYLGPKYFRELGYTDLYVCCAQAERELGAGAAVSRRLYRDLATNEFVPARSVLAAGRACKERFEPARWQTFVHDVAFFRREIPDWELSMQDWGYNASPAWNVLGALLAGDDPVTERQLGWLTLLDVPVLLVMWGLVAWAFGWRTLCVALIFWGTNYLGLYGWTGGSILRQEWLLASVAGVCLMKKQKFVAGGAALTYATTLSVFPGFMAAAIGWKALASGWRERRLTLSREHQRLLVGAGLALAVVLPASLIVAGRASAWADFVTNSRIDSQPAGNSVGLPALLSYDSATRYRILRLESNERRPAVRWTEARDRTLAARAPLRIALAAAYLVLLAGAARRHPDWVAAILGLGVIVFAFRLNSYYYVFLLLFGLLWPRHRTVGIALCAVAAASLWIGDRWQDDDELYARLSLLAVLFVGYATAVVRFARDPR